MGDRAYITFHDGTGETSPTVYLHFEGSEVVELLMKLRDLMADRNFDVSYVCARFIGICHDLITGNLSLGVYDSIPKDKSPGDAGHFYINCGTWDVNVTGGYFPKYKGAALDTKIFNLTDLGRLIK
jgi:hypothetical protein